MVSSPLVVVGLATTGAAMVRALTRRGHDVVVFDDHPSPDTIGTAESLGVDLIVSPDRSKLEDLVRNSEAVLPSPGIPDRHPVFAAARAAGVPIMSEFDLAAQWDDRPLLAVTGTDGKTTVTTLVTDMLRESGLNAVPAGNTGVPLVAAIDDPLVDVFVVEASSFRLGHTRTFSPQVATWLNFSADHLDVHSSIGAYESAKARIWRELGEGSTAIANRDDPVVMRNVVGSNTTITFGGVEADYHVSGSILMTPDSQELIRKDELWRSFPHDVMNGLAASATALSGGASLDAVRRALKSFRGLPHRVELIGEWDGVRWYDDSKATAPHATLAAIEGFESVILIAGGRNKGLDLSPLASSTRIRAVVAIGEAAGEVSDAFVGVCPVRRAESSMDEAVELASEFASSGDAVILSPGCASFDWYGSYAERGDAFADSVKRIIAGDESRGMGQ